MWKYAVSAEPGFSPNNASQQSTSTARSLTGLTCRLRPGDEHAAPTDGDVLGIIVAREGAAAVSVAIGGRRRRRVVEQSLRRPGRLPKIGNEIVVRATEPARHDGVVRLEVAPVEGIVGVVGLVHHDERGVLWRVKDVDGAKGSLRHVCCPPGRWRRRGKGAVASVVLVGAHVGDIGGGDAREQQTVQSGAEDVHAAVRAAHARGAPAADAADAAPLHVGCAPHERRDTRGDWTAYV